MKQCIKPFMYQDGPRRVHVPSGLVVADNDERVKRNAAAFADVETVIEQASAEPGQKRATKRSAKK